MAQTLVSLMVHVIFSTKNREPFITPELNPSCLLTWEAFERTMNRVCSTSVICGIEFDPFRVE